jgi:hypothetical protein
MNAEFNGLGNADEYRLAAFMLYVYGGILLKHIYAKYPSRADIVNGSLLSVHISLHISVQYGINVLC